ncbi:MAG TPA: type 1 glutamine amidotransferase [Nocardioidaceae bacterium]|jgi:GMP synthase-like glutamine amidotransferase
MPFADTADDERGALRVLVLQHEEPTPPGLVSDWLDTLGAETDVLRIDLEEPPAEPDRYDLIVSLGSEFGAYDDSLEFVRRETRFLDAAIEADVAILGLCFGGQMLARVLGGDVRRAARAEIGWIQVHTHDPELVPEGPWFQWHFDVMTAPPGATVLAESPAGLQAFVSGRNLGLQFHPEVTPGIVDDWVSDFRYKLAGEGVDPDALLEQTRQRAPENRRATFQLFDAYVERVAALASWSST